MARLREAGFVWATVRSVTVPIYKEAAVYFLWGVEDTVVGHEKTVYVELSW